MISGRNVILGFIFFYVSHSMAFESRPLNILFVVEYFPSLSQIYILNMITGLIDRGHNVSIFSFRKSNDPSIHPNVKKYNLLNVVTYENFPQLLPDCDIVFCQFGGLGKTIFEIPQLSEWLEQRKVVVCLRGFDVMGYVRNPSHINEHLFKKIDLFLPVCDYFRKRFIALGCPSEKVVVHHSAINSSQFFFKTRKKPIQGSIKIACVGRLVPKKGMPYAIKAIAQIIKKYKKVRLSIVGDGPEWENLNALIQKLNLSKKQIKLYGWRNHDKVVSILKKSHIFLLPSITPSNGNEEGIANALKEAMAMGLISIATWHAGTPELIDHEKSGFLVPEKNSTALANTIEYVIKHPEKWKSIALAARKKIENEFEIKKCAQELEEIFYSLLAKTKIDIHTIEHEQSVSDEDRVDSDTEELVHDAEEEVENDSI